ncbi:MAG: hypothetical protein IKE53_03430 [Clostridiales bacterium]|nr:hypothetical protein [Clostridiales bacterium]
MRYIYDLKQLPTEEMQYAGGKAHSLAVMIRDLGLNVPEGFVLLSRGTDGQDLLPEASDELDQLISSLSDKYTYAVRSSAINEDGKNSSFAGQYETMTDVRAEDVKEAVLSVISSAGSARVAEYTGSFNEEDKGIAVVIQRFVRPEMAGVVFTSDVISGRDSYMTGNFVRGEGELLVSGVSDAEQFRMYSVKYRYEGPEDMKRYAGKLFKACMKIRQHYKVPMDIEWAVSAGKVYILQARPITTLRRLDMDTYRVNGSLSGYKMLTRTNVGEIFMEPVSPMTFSVLEKINEMLGLPDWLDNICGQPYMNISVMCSLLVSFGKTPAQAFDAVRDLVGNVPEAIEVPISPFDRKAFLKNIKALLFPENKSKLNRRQKRKMVRDMDQISRDLISDIGGITDNEGLIRMWEDVLIPRLNDGLASILAECGTSMIPLFSTRKKITDLAGPDMANSLCGGCLGIIDSMKPLLLIEDVIAGRITGDEYMETVGHRSVSEMELMEPRPYEIPGYLDSLIEEHRKSNIDLHEMQRQQEQKFKDALASFKAKYPSRSKWIDRELSKFRHANDFREEIRSKGVRIFCVFREFLKKAGEINGTGDGIFMLTYNEVFELLRGNNEVKRFIAARRETFDRYRKYPVFPSLILGGFDPDTWLADGNRRSDLYCADMEHDREDLSADIKGFPGARGKVTGRVRVVGSIGGIGEIEEGDILVTTATNVGWTLVFSKVSGIVTDIGAPLSHAAIVAREFGIPAVVGCGNATTVLHTGDMVELDGAEGTVRIIK